MSGRFEAYDDHRDGDEGQGARESSGRHEKFSEGAGQAGAGRGLGAPGNTDAPGIGGYGDGIGGTGDDGRSGLSDDPGAVDRGNGGSQGSGTGNAGAGGGGDDPSEPGGPGAPGDRSGPSTPNEPDAPGGAGNPSDPDHPAGGNAPDPDRPPRIPLPRASVEDTGRPLTVQEEPPAPLVLEHVVLKALLGAWALAACSVAETAAVEDHLGVCGSCADEALRLREAVGLLQRPESLDLDPGLRTRVLDSCLDRRPPRIPIPVWATPYDAETARLDALLQDFGDAEWHAPVRLRWFDADEATSRRTTVAGVIAHLLSVDGLVAVALGLDDPMGEVPADAPTPAGRTEAYWRASHFPPTRSVRAPWREQGHDLVRTVSFTGSTSGKLVVAYGDFSLPLHDAMLDRAFECWVHAQDIAEAVDYPYEPPSPRHLNRMIDLAARMLPAVLADRRQKGLASPPHGRHLVSAGDPGRSLRLEVEGLGGGEWLIPLDSPAAVGSAAHEVAHVALDGVEFCQLAAGHVPPAEAAAGQLGDRDAIRDVLYAAASLSRL